MKSYQHFTHGERKSLVEKVQEGKSFGEIARELGRSKSSISRELKRNQNKNGSYNPWRATVLYIIRRRKSVRRPRLSGETLAFVIKGLQQYWSPEIIVIRWKQLHPGESLSPGTIYRAVRKGQLPAIHAKTHLRRRGKRRKPRTQSIKPEHTIHDRPTEIESRARLGDLEGDTVYGAIGKGCLVTFVDRRSRKLYAIRADNREKEHIAGKTQEALADAEVNTITLDNGSEFADFKNIEQALDATIYFADPRSPWQRGSNENTNGLIRFFFPKGTNFKAVDDEAVQQVVALINNRPRKCLGWLSSNEFLERCT